MIKFCIIKLGLLLGILCLLPLVGKSKFLSYDICNNTSRNKICFSVIPQSLQISYNNQVISQGVSNAKHVLISDIKKSAHKLSFKRNKVKIEITLQSNKSLLITFLSPNKISTTFPIIGKDANELILPIMGQGKDIPVHNTLWQQYLIKNINEQSKTDALNGLSMQFISSVYNNFAAVFIIKNIYDNSYWFKTYNNTLLMYFSHQNNVFNATHVSATHVSATHVSANKKFSYKIIITKPNITSISKTYLKSIKQADKFTTLSEKASNIPNVKKLYGAPFIYLWGDELIGANNVKWQKLRRFVKSKLLSKSHNSVKYFASLAHKRYHNDVLQRISNQNWISKFDKADFETLMTKLATQKDLYKTSEFTNVTKRNFKQLSPIAIVNFNKYLIQNVFHQQIKKVKFWGNGVSLWMINQLKSIGLKHAWLGLDDRKLGITHRNVVSEAVKAGYLVAPYDSYLSIQTKKNLKIPTALFQNNKWLYDNATVIGKNSKFIHGFLNTGRILNSSFAMPEVKYRLNNIINTYDVPFNSWFFDTDGSGDLYNDFSVIHPMSKFQDAENRFNRLKYAAKHYHLVVGTEDGNDFISQFIVFGQGNVTSGIWDYDMRHNKKSKYYMGSYYSALGIPPRYSKLTALKPIIATIYFSPKYSVPLYQLVYHNSVIVSSHWEYSTFKFKKEITNNIIKSFLYDFAPILHLDRKYWLDHKKFLKNYLLKWEKFSMLVSSQEMSYFSYLSRDHLIQMTKFANNIQVIANFSNKSVKYQAWTLAKKSIIVLRSHKLIFKFNAIKYIF